MTSFRNAPRFVVSHPSCKACPRPGDACSFQVAWSINPNMAIGSVSPARAAKQHAALVGVLEGAGARVQAIPFVHGAFDSVFSKDNAVLVERAPGVVEALLARPRHAERRMEQRARAAALAGMGVRVAGCDDAHLEGGDVVVTPHGHGAFLGHGFRSSPEAGRVLARFLGYEVTLLELHDPRLYHLDMVLSILDDGTALICDEALAESGIRTLEEHPAVTAIIRVPLEEALRFGANLVQVGRTIVTGADAPLTARALEAAGHDVVRVDLEQFHLAGGSAACLVSRIHTQWAAHAYAEEPQPTAA